MVEDTSSLDQRWHRTSRDGWLCAFADDDAQPCTLGRDHEGEHHADTSLRTWLATTPATAVIRVYEGDTALGQHQTEQVLFTRFGWRAIAGDDTTRTVRVGPTPGGVLILGELAAFDTKFVPVRRIVVCYARPPLIAS